MNGVTIEVGPSGAVSVSCPLEGQHAKLMKLETERDQLREQATRRERGSGEASPGPDL